MAKINSIKPVGEWFYVSLDHGIKTLDSGIILPDDDMTDFGIRGREATVLAVSDKVAAEGIGIGDTVLLEHLGWARGLVIEDENGDRLKIWPTQLEKVLLHRPKDA